MLVQRDSDFLGLVSKDKRKELAVGNVNFPRRHKIPLLSIDRAVRRLRLGTNPKSWGARNATIRHERLYPAKNVAGLFPLDGHFDEAKEARLAAPAHARDHFDEIGVAKEHRLLEVSVAALQSVALQEMLLKLKLSFTFGSITTPRRKRSQEPNPKDIGQNVCVSVGRCGNLRDPRRPKNAKPQKREHGARCGASFR